MFENINNSTYGMIVQVLNTKQQNLNPIVFKLFRNNVGFYGKAHAGFSQLANLNPDAHKRPGVQYMGFSRLQPSKPEDQF